MRMFEEKKPSRPWRLVAEELAREADPQKVRALIEELTRAIQFVRYDDVERVPPVRRPV